MGKCVSRTVRVAVKRLLFLMPLLIALPGVARCAERTYYSIHLQSFKNLKNTNAFVNSLKNKGKLVFWKKAQVPGKGEFCRVYLGKYKTEDEAFEFWKKLKEEGAVSYRGIHKFKETIEPPEKKVASLPPDKAPKPPPIKLTPIPAEERFVDNGDGTVTDRMTNLMWIKNGWRIDFVSAVKWNEARKKCEDFREGGYDNWRLPSIQEWKTLLDTEKECPALTEPNPFENIIVHMPYWSDTEFVYGLEFTCAKTPCPVHAYTVMLYFGRVNHQNKAKRAFILPVRSIN